MITTHYIIRMMDHPLITNNPERVDIEYTLPAIENYEKAMAIFEQQKQQQAGASANDSSP